jgi:cardiolipin synthase
MKHCGYYHQISQDAKWLTIPNILTIIRLLLSPIVAVAIIKEYWRIAFGIFVIAALTDIFDGFLARLLSDQSNLGQILDPVADKCFLLASFWSLAITQTPQLHVPLWFALFVLIREGVLVLGSMGMMFFYRNFRVQPIVWGKMTSFFQAIFIMWLFACYFCGWVPAKTFSVAIVVLSILSFFSLVQYCKIGFRYFRG